SDLREAYDDLKKLNAEVIAVSTSTDVDEWKKFIDEKNFGVMVNAADTQFKSNFRADYNVRSTPQVYVLDKDRKVIARKLDVEQLVDFIGRYQEYQ
ncbi:MAG: thioredoxin-like domain-containing protein, partial [Cyclobacteriaceae bacterium]